VAVAERALIGGGERRGQSDRPALREPPTGIATVPCSDTRQTRGGGRRSSAPARLRASCRRSTGAAPSIRPRLRWIGRAEQPFSSPAMMTIGIRPLAACIVIGQTRAPRFPDSRPL
jgi:hypothetical protein